MGLNGCGSVEIHDATIYGDKGALGASYAHLLTKESGDVRQPAWDFLRFGMLCMSSSDFANLKAELEELCHSSQDCTYEMQKQMQTFFDKIERLK